MRLSISPDAIQRVEFFKRDELTTDLICCEVTVGGEGGVQTWFFHEEAPEWAELLALIEQLPGFDTNWPDKVIRPAFVENRTIAFQR